jgi:DNA-binding transcriptional MerR regulator
MSDDTTHTVGQVAGLARVSVRALRHYDEIGLLEPSKRSDAGYRLYTLEDLERLQQILFYKELGFGLDDIGRIMTDPGFDRGEALLRQRELIVEKALRFEALLALIDRTITADEGGIRMTKEEMFELFGDFDPAEHEDEVKEAWGNTDAYRESSRRSKRYTKEDWARFKTEGEQQMARMIDLFDAGVAPDAPEAMDVAEAARLQIDTWFYPCSHEMHCGLAKLYIADARFTAYYDDHRSGLAVWFHDAIHANAERENG